MRLSWEQTAINLAFDIAKYRSEDPYVKVGACIIKQDNSIVLGYNGSPAGMVMDWSNRDERRKWVFHAESNVLNRILPGEAKLLAVTHMPCVECLKVIKQKEINTVYYSIRIPQYSPEVVDKMADMFQIKLIQLNYVTVQ
jgi:deoxycytidylate deaminase